MTGGVSHQGGNYVYSFFDKIRRDRNQGKEQISV